MTAVTPARIRIIAADDHPLVLKGLIELLVTQPDFEIVGQASDGAEAARIVCAIQPDILILDLSLPKLHGISVVKAIVNARCPTQVIVLTLHEERIFLNQVIEAGGRGYVLKRSSPDNVIHAIREVMKGGLYVDPAIAASVLDPAPGKQRNFPRIADMSPREAQVLELTARGLTSKEIAHRLDLSIKSVETFRARGSAKAGLTSRSDIVQYAIAQGWLTSIR